MSDPKKLPEGPGMGQVHLGLLVLFGLVVLTLVGACLYTSK